MKSIKVGEEYIVQHERKGSFRVKVKSLESNTADCVITGGTAYYVSEPNRGLGDRITLFTDRSFIRFYPVET